MDANKCIIMLILAILFVSFIVGVIQNIVDINKNIVDINNKITEMFDDISLLKITSNNTLIAMNSYYSTIRESQTEIEEKLLTEIACLATKNNEDIKRMKGKFQQWDVIGFNDDIWIIQKIDIAVNGDSIYGICSQRGEIASINSKQILNATFIKHAKSPFED